LHIISYKNAIENKVKKKKKFDRKLCVLFLSVQRTRRHELTYEFEFFNELAPKVLVFNNIHGAVL